MTMQDPGADIARANSPSLCFLLDTSSSNVRVLQEQGLPTGVNCCRAPLVLSGNVTRLLKTCGKSIMIHSDSLIDCNKISDSIWSVWLLRALYLRPSPFPTCLIFGHNNKKTQMLLSFVWVGSSIDISKSNPQARALNLAPLPRHNEATPVPLPGFLKPFLDQLGSLFHPVSH